MSHGAVRGFVADAPLWRHTASKSMPAFSAPANLQNGTPAENLYLSDIGRISCAIFSRRKSRVIGLSTASAMCNRAPYKFDVDQFSPRRHHQVLLDDLKAKNAQIQFFTPQNF